jgi:hypothetical protein
MASFFVHNLRTVTGRDLHTEDGGKTFRKHDVGAAFKLSSGLIIIII